MKARVAALAMTILATVPAQADLLPLSEISGYLNDMQTGQAAFTQINDDGTLSTGTLFINRPGRMRFEYDPPEDAVVVAGGGAVVIFDPRSNAAPETYPLKRTPLSIILESQVDLDRRDMVVGHSFDGTATLVRAQDPENPQYGHIDLSFTGSPVELRKWVITDGAGSQTTVILQDFATGVDLPASLFNTTTIGERMGR